jgi:hypothetical protein
MNASILNYPGFQTLPKGIKQMLLVSEAFFFAQTAPHDVEADDFNGSLAMPLRRARGLFGRHARRRCQPECAGLAQSRGFSTLPAAWGRIKLPA